MSAVSDPHVICFLSSKGGSGKTVTSSALATFLSALGFSVLMIDADASTNGLTLLFLEQLIGKARRTDDSVGIFEAHKTGSAPNAVAITDKLRIVPAAYRMQQTQEYPIEEFERALLSVIDAGSSEDFILIDAQAGSDKYARIAASLSDAHILVSEYDPVSSQGLDRLKVLFAEVLTPSNTWTLFNKILPELAKAIGEGLAVARYLPPITWDADVVRAFSRRDLAVNMDVPNAYTFSISEVALAVAPDTTGDSIEDWRRSVIESATNPMKSRLDELKTTKDRLIYQSKKRRTFRGFMQIFPQIIGIPVIFILYIFKITESDLTLSIVMFVLAISAISGRYGQIDDEGNALRDVLKEIEALSANIAASEALASKSDGIFSRIRRDKSRMDRGSIPAE